VSSAEGLLEAADRPTKEAVGACAVPGVALEDPQIVDGEGDVGVMTTEEWLEDRKRACEQAAGASGPAPLLLEAREAGQREPDLEAPAAEGAPEDGEGPHVEIRRLVEAAAGFDDGGEGGEVGREGRVCRPDERGSEPHR
jgi:hypothetical protein